MNGKTIVTDWGSRTLWRTIFASILALSVSASSGWAQNQSSADTNIEVRIQALTVAMNRIEAQMQESQQELADIRRQLSDLRRTPVADPSQTSGAAKLAEAVASLRESQSINESQIATLEQTKVETASKYPLKLSGMILMTGFVNTHRVDMPATPVVALSGSGSTGATFQQSILGFDINGPHVFGARSYADLRFDFDGGPVNTQSGNGSPQIRLRTAHANLNWDHTRLLFALDRSLLSPETPASLVAVAQPALAWSGNLWTWNPQLGISRDLISTSSGALEIRGALIDVGDPPSLYTSSQTDTYVSPGTAELSRWPGIEGHIGYQSANEGNGIRFGVSGLVSPHNIPSLSRRFSSWAGAADFAFPISRYTRLSGNAYSGAGLGGLGGGAYKDYAWRSAYGETYFRVLDDHGGWLQWKQRAGERLEFNEAFGIDNVPAHQLRPYASSTSASYRNLARNRTVSGNVIYSPNASLLFSIEYRRIASSYVTSPTWSSDVIGLGAGYKF